MYCMRSKKLFIAYFSDELNTYLINRAVYVLVYVSIKYCTAHLSFIYDSYDQTVSVSKYIYLLGLSHYIIGQRLGIYFYNYNYNLY